MLTVPNPTKIQKPAEINNCLFPTNWGQCWCQSFNKYELNFTAESDTGNPETYSKPSQTSKMEIFGKSVNSLMPLTIFANSCILDI